MTDSVTDKSGNGERAQEDARLLMNTWNTMAAKAREDADSGLRVISHLTGERVTTALRIIHVHGLDQIETAFSKVAASAWLNGTHPKSQWHGTGASFDWVLREENFVRILEGTFDDPKGEGALTAADHEKGF